MIYSGFWKRCLALILDLLIICILLTIAGLLIQALFFKGRFYSGGMVSSLYVFIFIIVYFALFEMSLLQATPGKLVAGIKIAGFEGEKLSLGKSFIRSFIKTIIIIPFFAYMFTTFSLITKLLSISFLGIGLSILSILWPVTFLMLVCLFTKHKQNLYDLAANSIVIYKEIYNETHFDADDTAAAKAFEEFKNQKAALHPALMILVILFLTALPVIPLVSLFVNKPALQDIQDLRDKLPPMPKYEWKQHNLNDIGLTITAPGDFKFIRKGVYHAYTNAESVEVYYEVYDDEKLKEQYIDSVKKRLIERILHLYRRQLRNMKITENKKDIEISGLKGTETVLKAERTGDFYNFDASFVVINKNEREIYLIYAISRENSLGRNIVDKIISSVEITEITNQNNEQYNKEVEKIAKEITPGREGEFIDKANNLSRSGNDKEALKYYDAVVKVNPNNSRVYYNRSAAKIGLKDYRGAVEDASASIKISPTSYAYQNRITANQRLEEWQNALDDINIYINNNWPNKEDFYYQKGRCLMKLGHYEEAVKLFDEYEQAVSQRYKKDLYRNRAYCYDRLGDTKKADIDYGKAKMEKE